MKKLSISLPYYTRVAQNMDGKMLVTSDYLRDEAVSTV
jgi:hypothetical protein